MTTFFSHHASRPKIYTSILCLLLLTHFIWYIGAWPGPMGQDGYSLIANINEGAPKYTGKDPAWLLYALATYGLTNRLEAIVIPLIILHIILFTRIIGWFFLQGHRKTGFLLLTFIACTPHILNFETSIYQDSIFSLAFIGCLFEIWICLKSKRISKWSMILIAITFPIAAFFKSNGILIVAPLLYLAHRSKGSDRWIIIAIIILWSTVIQIGGKIHDLGKGHGALAPLILFETVNFMQTKPMNLWETRHMVTEKTKKIIHKYISQEDIDNLFDRDYWDTLWHLNQDRIKFREMTKEDRRILQNEFFTYNLWRNLPAFTSSRVNIFLAAAFAQGGIIAPDNAKNGLKLVETKSKYNPFGLISIPKAIKNLFDISYKLRFFLWTPLVGVILIIYCAKLAIHSKKTDEIIITTTMLLQLLGIFIFSIAAEYRYLLIIFFSPLVLLPVLFFMKKHIE